MDSRHIDGTKLMYHPHRVCSFLIGNDPYPIYTEISLTGACNHRCKFCALDFTGYKANMIEQELLILYLKRMRSRGLKSVMFGGEGEPLLHPEVIQITKQIAGLGLDIGITTNGVFLTKDYIDICSPVIDWIKVSVDAGLKSTYDKLRKAKATDWTTVWKNIQYAAKKGTCDIGVQMLLLKENEDEVLDFVRRAADSGAKYAVIKQYSQHPKSLHKRKVIDTVGIEEMIPTYNKDFEVIVRSDVQSRDYDECRAIGFWSYIQANGDIWACSAHLMEDAFKIGNIKMTDDDMSAMRRLILQMMHNYDVSSCRLNCRMNSCNQYMHDIINTPKHGNFI